jgi:hypothetical protein
MTTRERHFQETEAALHRFDLRTAMARYCDASELPPVPISSHSLLQPKSGPSEEEIRAINEREARWRRADEAERYAKGFAE